MSEMGRWEAKLRSMFQMVPARNDMPAVVFDLFYSGGFGDDIDLLAEAIEDAWTASEFPQRLVDADCWIEFFNEAGFIENGRVAPHPKSVPPLYRSAADPYAYGLSWTEDYEQAEWFYRRNVDYFGFPSKLLRLDNPDPVDVLAKFHSARNEAEWVLRPDGTDQAVEVTL
ncbi:hypothetical protein [Microbacterium soli]|uniref:Uncharacterized protein n=1 Tax=Microbacterium soli TaxID=446075 RepID=A0ABP7NBA7_9MICO